MDAMQKAWREYLEFAAGATQVSRKEAAKLAKKLLGKGGATAEQLQSLAADLVATSAANREALAKLVRFEVDRALGAVGLATAEEVEELTARVRDLERQLRETKSAGSAAPAAEPVAEAAEPGAQQVPGQPAQPSPPAATKKTAKKAAKAPTTKAAKAPARKTAKAPAKKATKTVAKKAPKSVSGTDQGSA